MKTNVQGEAEERDRKVEPYLEDQLIQLADLVDVQNFTAGNKAKSRDCFGPLPVTVRIMSQGGQDFKKRHFLSGVVDVPPHAAAFYAATKALDLLLHPGVFAVTLHY